MARWSEEDLRRHSAKKLLEKQPKPSKYRNVKVVVDGHTFDSKREARHWGELKVRERIGEIRNLEHHPKAIDLLCPSYPNMVDHQGFANSVVSRYEPDFTYEELIEDEWVGRVVDAKGKKTAIYMLKKRWLFLQSGIEILEV